MRKVFAITGILIIASLVLAACGGAAPTEAPAPAEEAPAEEAPAEEAPAESAGGGILDRVKARGTLICGGRTDLAGFGVLDDAGNNSGFDIDLCRAIAAAVLGDANAIEVVPLTAADRGPSIQTAEVDVLTRNVTWTSSRDAQWGNFTIVMFYDGQGFMVSEASGITSTDQFDGATVCVTSGTTTEQNLATFFRQNGMTYEAVIFEETAAVYSAYEEGRCDITTSDKSQLASVRMGFADPGAHIILPDTISKEPLTPAVPHGDDAWFDTVKIVMYALINAEELGITQANVEEMKSGESIDARVLLGTGDIDWGYSDLGLDADALARAISAVGNYGEIYDRYITPIGIPRGPNELWTNGGALYAPPIK